MNGTKSRSGIYQHTNLLILNASLVETLSLLVIFNKNYQMFKRKLSMLEYFYLPRDIGYGITSRKP